MRAKGVPHPAFASKGAARVAVPPEIYVIASMIFLV
jgi:hypothetical protein